MSSCSLLPIPAGTGGVGQRVDGPADYTMMIDNILEFLEAANVIGPPPDDRRQTILDSVAALTSQCRLVSFNFI